jgi:hypothetical protein
MIEAKCYGVFGFWRYYRTPDGRTFSVRDNKVFYHGNVKKKKKKSCYPIFIKNVEKLRKFVNFVD